MAADRMDWFPFYAQDFLTSRAVKRMSDANVGRYAKLLCEQWIHAPLPRDMGELGALIGLSPSRMVEAWREIGPAFKEVEGGFANERLEAIREEQRQKMEKRAALGRKAAEVRWENERNADAMRPHANRKEKNREEKKDSPTESRPKRRKVPLPDDWTPKESHQEFATANGLSLIVEVEKFKAHHGAEGTLFVDWDKGFWKWLHNAVSFRQRDAEAASKRRSFGGKGKPQSFSYEGANAVDPDEEPFFGNAGDK